MASGMNEEIEEVKKDFPGRCRVVYNGLEEKFTHSITIQPKDMDITIKFQLTDKYPTVTPTITARSSSLEDNDNSDLIQALKSEATRLKGACLVKKLVNFAEQWLKERGLGRGTKIKKAQKKHKQKKKILDVEPAGKQASMKTSEDVIKRIQWDADLPQEDFLVGYIDRFLGIQEKYFDAFSWEDISTVDYNVLAIPQHRIQYFKYKELKVWDKNEKLDNVFGSLGSGKTITDVIQNYVPPEPTSNVNKTDSKTISGSDDDDSDSDSDDGVIVTLDTTTVNTQSYLDHQQKRPTHFIAIRLDNPETVQRLTDVQLCLKTAKPQLESGLMPPACFHVTLCTLGLDTPDQIREAKEVLLKCQSELSRMRPSESLKLTGVDNFYNRTVYAKIKYPQQFLDFVDHVKMCFTTAGIDIRDNYGFVPHITLLKISKYDSRQLGSRFLISDVYHDFKDSILGSQAIDRLSLCKMGEERQEDGFWVSLQDIDLNS